MTKRQTKYIVKRNYDNRRTDTDAFLRLIKKSSKLSKDNEIEYNKYKIDSSSGWTLYLGSNLESNGAWFSSDEYNELMASDNFNPSDIHKYFKNKAIENYKSYNIFIFSIIY